MLYNHKNASKHEKFNKNVNTYFEQKEYLKNLFELIWFTHASGLDPLQYESVHNTHLQFYFFEKKELLLKGFA